MGAHADTPLQDADHMRLRRIAERCQRGEASGAELDLITWHHHGRCPAEARLLLASLLAARGERGMAQRVLERIDALAGQAALLMLSLCAGLGWDAAAEHLANRLLAAPEDQALRPMVAAMGYADALDAGQLSNETEALAAALANQPALIATLVAAQKRQVNQDEVSRLRAGLAHLAEREQADAALLCETRAELALLAGDAVEAGDLARAGLQVDPYRARLALILVEAEQQAAAKPDARPTAREALERVRTRWPEYPDVRAAWIRAMFRDGHATAARDASNQWLTREPASKVARELAREVAA